MLALQEVRTSVTILPKRNTLIVSEPVTMTGARAYSFVEDGSLLTPGTSSTPYLFTTSTEVIEVVNKVPSSTGIVSNTKQAVTQRNDVILPPQLEKQNTLLEKKIEPVVLRVSSDTEYHGGVELGIIGSAFIFSIFAITKLYLFFLHLFLHKKLFW